MPTARRSPQYLVEHKKIIMENSAQNINESHHSYFYDKMQKNSSSKFPESTGRNSQEITEPSFLGVVATASSNLKKNVNSDFSFREMNSSDTGAFGNLSLFHNENNDYIQVNETNLNYNSDANETLIDTVFVNETIRDENAILTFNNSSDNETVEVFNTKSSFILEKLLTPKQVEMGSGLQISDYSNTHYADGLERQTSTENIHQTNDENKKTKSQKQKYSSFQYKLGNNNLSEKQNSHFDFGNAIPLENNENYSDDTIFLSFPNFHEIQFQTGKGVANFSPNFSNREQNIHRNSSREMTKNGTVSNVKPSNFRPEEMSIIVLVLLLWVAAILLFINRWGKLRMVDPYQPAYSAPVTTPRTNNLPANNIGCQNRSGSFSSHSPGNKRASITDARRTIDTKPRVDSLSVFRDNFKEGFSDSYWSWNKNGSKSRNQAGKVLLKSSPVRCLSPAASYDYCGIESERLLDYRRASCGSVTGLTIRPSPVRRMSDFSATSMSMSGSTSFFSPQYGDYWPLVHRDSITSQRRISTHTLADGWKENNDQQAITGITVTNENNVTRNLVPNQDISHTSNPDVREKFPIRGKRRLNRSHVTFEETLGLTPLTSHMKVKSAVDLVSLVMQEQGNYY